MSLQKDNMITKQEQEQHIEDKDYLQILGNQKRTSRTGSQDTLIVIYISTQQKTVENQRKKERLESITNVIKWNTLQRIIRQDRR